MIALSTSGDRSGRGGGSTDFTDAIDAALRSGAIDLGIHSAKDLPSRLPDDLLLAACPERGDPRDCLVVAPGRSAARLPAAARVGSSSPRRGAQLLRWRPDLKVVPLRGNVDTRLAKVATGTLDAAVLAAAGLVRLRKTRAIAARLPVSRFLPAPGQAALAVVTRRHDRLWAARAGAIDDASTHACVRAEQALADALGGSCRMPLGALATLRGSRLLLEAELLTPDGKTALRTRVSGRRGEPEATGAAAAERLDRLGAREILKRVGS